LTKNEFEATEDARRMVRVGEMMDERGAPDGNSEVKLIYCLLG
jgi:hypothetical protein